MLDAIEHVQRYVEGIDKDAFRTNDIVHDAVVRQLEILGEAAGRISRETCARHPGIPWARVTGLRHRLIHDYFEVDLGMVWKVATDELNKLRPQVESLLATLSESPEPEA